ncbi:MFS transporter [Streptomyces sp. CA-253872]|uniref:MFS transporter n=1 Tax=Streptomyces sp. CA-253872 TaxID=3240067 RepID=UPI003D89E612
MAEAAVGGARESAPAWRGGFGRLWGAAAVSSFGDAVRAAALPLLATTLTREPLLIAAVSACGYLPWLLFGLLGGALADRVDQRRAMVAVDLVRGVLVALFAVAVARGHATIGLLLALAFALTSMETLFDNAATALLPALVPPEQLGRANGRLMTGQQLVKTVAGLPAAPLLLAGGAALPFATDAASYLVAAVLVAPLRRVLPGRPPRRAGSTLRAEIAEGLRTLAGDRALRGLCAATTLCNIGVASLVATLVLVSGRHLHLGTTGYALLLTAYGVGGICGGLLATPLARRVGQARTVLLAGTGQILCLLVLGLAPGGLVAGAALGVFGGLGMAWNVSSRTLMQRAVRRELLGRVSAAFRTCAVAGAPLGALTGGAVVRWWGPAAPPFLAAVFFVLSVLALLPAVRAVAGGAPRESGGGSPLLTKKDTGDAGVPVSRSGQGGPDDA